MTSAWPLIGHVKAEQDFVSAMARDKLHHGWLIEGPSGIGKSLLAMRLAAHLLGARGSTETPMDVSAHDPVAQKMLSAAHPDFRRVVRERNERDKLRQDITVDQIRDLTHFFSLKPALGGWRVGMIDALDELNANGANALLKTLEEPPRSSVLFLINHGSKPILPTIRSRCRVLRLQRLNDEDTRAVLEQQDGPTEAVALSRGRPGHGLQLATPAGLSAASTARALVKSLPQQNDSLMADALQTASADRTALDAFLNEILVLVGQQAEENPSAAKTWLELSHIAGEARELNMEPAQTASKLIAALYARR